MPSAIPDVADAGTSHATIARASAEDRQNELQAAITTAIDARAAWVDSPEPYITEGFETAVTDLLQVFSHGSVPDHLRRHADCVAEMAVAWNEWQRQAVEIGVDTATPGDAFWRAFDRLADLEWDGGAEEAGRLESVEQLRKEGVGDEQIARIYGWVKFRRTPAGDMQSYPETWKVQEELDKPGRHTGPGTGWKPPLQAKAEAREKERRVAAERVRMKQAAKVQRASTHQAPPESLEELVKQGVGAEQIARMLATTVQAVWAECDRQGLERPKNQEPVTAAMSPAMGREARAASSFMKAGLEGVRQGPAGQAADTGESAESGEVAESAAVVRNRTRPGGK